MGCLIISLKQKLQLAITSWQCFASTSQYPLTYLGLLALLSSIKLYVDHQASVGAVS